MMAKIMEIIAKETKGKSCHTYKYSYDSIGLPSIDYDDDPNKIMKWKDSAETGSPKRPIDLKPLADQLQEIGESPLLKYFLDGSHHVFKVDDIAYNKPMIDGKVGFLYLDKNDMSMVALHWEKYFQHICEKYNKIYKVEMPKVTPHVCRHTFCSNMAKSGMNPKTLQKIMGHSDIGVTLNTYTHVGFDDIQKEMKKICS